MSDHATTPAAARTSHDGLALPPIGFGTYQLNGQDGARTVATAIEGGYRLIDSAVNYENEGAVGRGVRDSGAPREEIIVTSKLPGRRHERQQATRAIEESVLRVGLDYLDLYLIHWPNPSVDRYVEAWEALIEARERGLVRAIGVSNFLPEHLDRLVRETGVMPSVNQIELHPRVPQRERLAANEARGVLTEAWSPLGRPKGVVDEPAVAEVAAAHGCTPTQAVLAWTIARGAIPIPKSSDPARQRENLEAAQIALDPSEVERISSLAFPDGRENPMDPAVHEEM